MEKQIQDLNPRHFKILEYCLRGWTNVQIAENLSMSAQQISIVTNSPSFQHEIAIRRSKLNELSNNAIVAADDEITSAIKSGAKAAVERLLGSINSIDEQIAIKASESILDRSGYSKVQKIESKSLSVVLTAEDASIIRDTMLLDRDA